MAWLSGCERITLPLPSWEERILSQQSQTQQWSSSLNVNGSLFQVSLWDLLRGSAMCGMLRVPNQGKTQLQRRVGSTPRARGRNESFPNRPGPKMVWLSGCERITFQDPRGRNASFSDKPGKSGSLDVNESLFQGPRGRNESFPN